MGADRSCLRDPQRHPQHAGQRPQTRPRGVHERANTLLEDGGRIGQLTPHTLRRTFASLLAEVGVSPRRAMYLLGHSDPKLTMRVYQQVLDMDGRAPVRLEEILGCGLDEAFTTLSGRQVLAPNGHRALDITADGQPAGGAEGSETHASSGLLRSG